MTEVLELGTIQIDQTPAMTQKISASVEIREGRSVQTKIPLSQMTYMLYFLVFMMLMFNVPFFMFLPLWMENEFNARPEKWNAFNQETLLMMVLLLGSFDFIQPLITPYIKNHIRLQCKVCFVCGAIANFLFLCASAKQLRDIVPPISTTILAAIFTGFCNCVHLYEYFIREMTSDKTKQSEIIENVAICQILGMILVIIICSASYDGGQRNDNGFACLNGVCFLFGLLGTAVLFYFIENLPPKPYYPPDSPTPSMWKSSFQGIPEQVLVILAIRGFVSFNFGLVRVILPKHFQKVVLKIDKLKKYVSTVFGSMFMIAIIISMSFLYFTRDTYHRKKWIWFPYVQLFISGLAPFILICLAFTETFWLQYLLGMVGTGLSLLMQAKLTIDRNLMSTDEILPKTSNISLIANGVATAIAVSLAPHLQKMIGIKALLINAANLFLVFVALFSYHKKTSLKQELEKFRDVDVLFENKFLNHLFVMWATGEKMSQVGKTRLLEEIKKHESDIKTVAVCTMPKA